MAKRVVSHGDDNPAVGKQARVVEMAEAQPLLNATVFPAEVWRMILERTNRLRSIRMVGATCKFLRALIAPGAGWSKRVNAVLKMYCLGVPCAHVPQYVGHVACMWTMQRHRPRAIEELNLDVCKCVAVHYPVGKPICPWQICTSCWGTTWYCYGHGHALEERTCVKCTHTLFTPNVYCFVPVKGSGWGIYVYEKQYLPATKYCVSMTPNHPTIMFVDPLRVIHPSGSVCIKLRVCI